VYCVTVVICFQFACKIIKVWLSHFFKLLHDGAHRPSEVTHTPTKNTTSTRTTTATAKTITKPETTATTTTTAAAASAVAQVTKQISELKCTTPKAVSARKS